MRHLMSKDVSSTLDSSRLGWKWREQDKIKKQCCVWLLRAKTNRVISRKSTSKSTDCIFKVAMRSVLARLNVIFWLQRSILSLILSFTTRKHGENKFSKVKDKIRNLRASPSSNHSRPQINFNCACTSNSHATQSTSHPTRCSFPPKPTKAKLKFNSWQSTRVQCHYEWSRY